MDPFKNHTILKVLQLAGIYSMDNYRFSQYSAGESVSLTKSEGGRLSAHWQKAAPKKKTIDRLDPTEYMLTTQ